METTRLRVAGAQTTSYSSFEDLHIAELTLATWRINSSVDFPCTMKLLTEFDANTGEFDVQELEKDLDYVFCVANGRYDLCAFFRLGIANYSVEKNCVSLHTRLTPVKEFDVFIVVVPLLALLVVAIFIVFLYFHRQTLVLKMLLNYCCCRSCYCYRKHAIRHKSVLRRSGTDVSEIMTPPDQDTEALRGDHHQNSSSTLLSNWRSRLGLLDKGDQGGEFIDDADLYLAGNLYQRSHNHSQIDSFYQTQPFGGEDGEIQTSLFELDKSAYELRTTNESEDNTGEGYTGSLKRSEKSTAAIGKNLTETDSSIKNQNHYTKWPMYQYQICYSESSADDMSSKSPNRSGSHKIGAIYDEPIKRPKTSDKLTKRPHSVLENFPSSYGCFINNKPNSESNHAVIKSRPSSMIATSNISGDGYIDSTFGLSPIKSKQKRNSLCDASANNVYVVCSKDSRQADSGSLFSDKDKNDDTKSLSNINYNTLPRIKRSQTYANGYCNDFNQTKPIFPGDKDYVSGHLLRSLDPPTSEKDDISYQGSDKTDSSSTQGSQNSDSKSIKSVASSKIMKHLKRTGLYNNGAQHHVQKSDAELIEQEYKDFLSPISEDRRRAKKRSSFFRPKSAPIVRIPKSISENPFPEDDIFQGHPSLHAVPPLVTDDDGDNDKDKLLATQQNNYGNDDDTETGGNDYSDATSMTTLPNSEMISSFDEDVRNLVTPFVTGDSTSDDADDIDEEDNTIDK